MLLNRPSLHGFGRAAYDVVLRCSGIATDFHGYHGRSVDEERFVAWFLAGRPVGMRFDVGAYHGANARYLRRLSSEPRIHAFAPYPKSFEILQSSNQFDTSMVLCDFAFEDGSTQASPDESAIKLFAANAMTHDVTVTTIDVFMAGHAIDRIQFLNIDTRVSTLPCYAVHAPPRPHAPCDVKRCDIHGTRNLVALPVGQFKVCNYYAICCSAHSCKGIAGLMTSDQMIRGGALLSGGNIK